MSISKMAEEQRKIKRFSQQMHIELKNNRHKGSVLDFTDFNEIITELEYHKAKMFVAIRTKNYPAVKEYIADSANFLLAIGNIFGLYDKEPDSLDITHELNDELITQVHISEQKQNQNIV